MKGDKVINCIAEVIEYKDSWFAAFVMATSLLLQLLGR